METFSIKVLQLFLFQLYGNNFSWSLALLIAASCLLTHDSL